MSPLESHTRSDHSRTSGIGGLRFTIFGIHDFPEPTELFQKFFNQSPDQTNINNVSAEYDLIKSTHTHSFQIKKVGEKTDFLINASSKIHFGADHKIQAESGLPLLPTELDLETSFFDSAKNLIAEYADGIVRMAVSHTHVIRSTKGSEAEALKKILPGVAVPAGCEEFLYRLNIPSELSFEDACVRINRLAQWTAATLQVELGISQGEAKLIEIGSGATVTTDINSAATSNLLKFKAQYKIEILERLIEYSKNIIEKGEIV